MNETEKIKLIVDYLSKIQELEKENERIEMEANAEIYENEVGISAYSLKITELLK